MKRDAVKMFHPPNSLRDLAGRPGGLSIEDALAGAEKGLDSIREECIAAIDAKIEGIARLLTAEGGDREAAYRLANEVFSESGAFGLSALSQAAYSLCSLLCSPSGAKCQSSLRVHVDALFALRGPGDERSRAAVLAGLNAVSARFAAG